MDWQDLIFKLVGGLGIFLFGIKYMSDGLQKSAGDKMRGLLERYTSNPILGVLVGFSVTGIDTIVNGDNGFGDWACKCGPYDFATSHWHGRKGCILRSVMSYAVLDLLLVMKSINKHLLDDIGRLFYLQGLLIFFIELLLIRYYFQNNMFI